MLSITITPSFPFKTLFILLFLLTVLLLLLDQLNDKVWLFGVLISLIFLRVFIVQQFSILSIKRTRDGEWFIKDNKQQWNRVTLGNQTKILHHFILMDFHRQHRSSMMFLIEKSDIAPVCWRRLVKSMNLQLNASTE